MIDSRSSKQTVGKLSKSELSSSWNEQWERLWSLAVLKSGASGYHKKFAQLLIDTSFVRFQTATTPSEKRFAVRTALAGLMTFAACDDELFQKRIEPLAPLECLLDALADIDVGVVCEWLKPALGTHPSSSAEQRGFRIDCIHAVECLIQAGFKVAMAEAHVAERVSKAAALIGFQMGPNTLRHWRTEHRKMLKGDSEYAEQEFLWWAKLDGYDDDEAKSLFKSGCGRRSSQKARHGKSAEDLKADYRLFAELVLSGFSKLGG